MLCFNCVSKNRNSQDVNDVREATFENSYPLSSGFCISESSAGVTDSVRWDALVEFSFGEACKITPVFSTGITVSGRGSIESGLCSRESLERVAFSGRIGT